MNVEWNETNSSVGPSSQGCSMFLELMLRFWRQTRVPIWSSLTIHTYTAEIHHLIYMVSPAASNLTWLLPCGGLELSAKTGWLGSCLPRVFSCCCFAGKHRSCLPLWLQDSFLMSPPQDTLWPWLPCPLLCKPSIFFLKICLGTQKSQNLCSFWYYILLEVVNWGWLLVWIWRRQGEDAKNTPPPSVISLPWEFKPVEQ